MRASPVLAGLGVLCPEPHGSDLAVHVLPAEAGDLALAHARDEGEADEVLQPLGRVRHDGLQLPPGRKALPGILLLQHGNLDLCGEEPLLMGEPEGPA